jgi:hypothetical protein
MFLVSIFGSGAKILERKDCELLSLLISHLNVQKENFKAVLNPRWLKYKKNYNTLKRDDKIEITIF